MIVSIARARHRRTPELTSSDSGDNMRRQEISQFVAALAVTAALALPMAAQQGAASGADQQAAQATSSDQNQQQPSTTSQAGSQAAGTASQPAGEANQNQAANQPLSQQQVDQRKLVPETRQGFWGKINPFARKKYVAGQLSPIRDRVNELDELTAENGRAIADLNKRADAGISAAQQKADQANQSASDAEQKTQQLSGRADQLDQQVTTVNKDVQNIDQYNVAQTADIQFRPGRAMLNDQAKQALDNFLNGLQNQKGYIVEVTAYSAGRGERAISNSQNLADTVVRYMVLEHNIPLFRIYTMGMGNAPVPASSTQAQAPQTKRLTRGGRVEIQILHNDLAQAGPAPTNPAAPAQPQQQQ
jgi:outer membrane protein OmpA-like peptidoglycan-associated protein